MTATLAAFLSNSGLLLLLLNCDLLLCLDPSLLPALPDCNSHVGLLLSTSACHNCHHTVIGHLTFNTVCAGKPKIIAPAIIISRNHLKYWADLSIYNTADPLGISHTEISKVNGTKGKKKHPVSEASAGLKHLVERLKGNAYRKSTVTLISTLHPWGKQKNISACTTHETLRFHSCQSRTGI